MSSEPISLAADRLSHAFGQGESRTVVLHQVSLELRRGEVVLLMGPSGSGKSTLLAVLSGLLRPDEGQVVVLGNDVWKLPNSLRKQFRLECCSFIFQGHNLFPALSAREQLELVLRWGHGADEDVAKQRTNDVLERLGLSAKANLRPAQLSGGEKQRIAIGRAMVKGAPLCFADEPTSALDWNNAKRAIEMLCQQTRENDGSMVIASHDSRLIPYATRLWRLEDGRLSVQQM